MIFLTVGTVFPFDRLVRAIDIATGNGLIEEEVFAQIGTTSFQPTHLRYVDFLDKYTFDQYFKKSTFLISHAGIGTIATALDFAKPLLVMPRMRCFNEHVNDHQIATARRFEKDGYLLAAYNVEEIPAKIEQLKSFVPRRRQTQAEEVAERISVFLNELCELRK